MNPSQKSPRETELSKLDNYLIQAVKDGDLFLVKSFLELGADPNVVNDETGWPLAVQAVVHKRTDIINHLISQDDIDLNATDRSGLTALMMAAFHGQLEISESLLAAGVDTGIRSNDGNTARDIANQRSNNARDIDNQRRYTDVVELLREYEAKENQADSKEGAQSNHSDAAA